MVLDLGLATLRLAYSVTHSVTHSVTRELAQRTTGPTHDDITYEAISKALGLKIELHAGTHERMKVHYEERGIELNESRLRMAHLPTPCRVLPPSSDIWVPLCNVGGNVGS